MSPLTLDEEIQRAAGNLPGIAVLVLFGSRAQGTQRPDSDLDVAVLPDTNDSRARRYLQADLAVALADLAPDGRVDVILLDEAPDFLRQRIMETGRVLINRDNEAWKELRVRTMREYGDSEYYRRIYREAQKRRLERGEPSGRSAKAIESLKRVGKLPR
jgi:predicted nucleotidyltransferase